MEQKLWKITSFEEYDKTWNSVVGKWNKLTTYQKSFGFKNVKEFFTAQLIAIQNLANDRVAGIIDNVFNSEAFNKFTKENLKKFSYQAIDNIRLNDLIVAETLKNIQTTINNNRSDTLNSTINSVEKIAGTFSWRSWKLSGIEKLYLSYSKNGVDECTLIDFNNYYIKKEVDALLDLKQNKLIAGENISISKDNVISVDNGLSIEDVRNDIQNYKYNYPLSPFPEEKLSIIEIIGNILTAYNVLVTKALPEKQDLTDNSLQTNNKNIVGAINELNDRKAEVTKEYVDNADNKLQTQIKTNISNINLKQNITDNSLQTKAKEIVPAINELSDVLNNRFIDITNQVTFNGIDGTSFGYLTWFFPTFLKKISTLELNNTMYRLNFVWESRSNYRFSAMAFIGNLDLFLSRSQKLSILVVEDDGDNNFYGHWLMLTVNTDISIIYLSDSRQLGTGYPSQRTNDIWHENYQLILERLT